VIENGVAVPRDIPYRPRPLRLRIGSVGRLVELKGQHLVLDAIAALPHDQRARIEVHLFGDGPERSALANRAAASLRDVPVTFHGMVIDREQIYSAIDVLAVGSRTEGQSMAIMEAMARGVPAIATNVGGNAELVRDGDTGLLVPPGDPFAMRDAIARMLADFDLVCRLGRASHALIAAQHSIDAVAAKYLALYS
jgi:glycosyltransferase involved in cell wall biosynthesis